VVLEEAEIIHMSSRPFISAAQ